MQLPGWLPLGIALNDHRTCCSVDTSGYTHYDSFNDIDGWEVKAIRRAVGFFLVALVEETQGAGERTTCISASFNSQLVGLAKIRASSIA